MNILVMWCLSVSSLIIYRCMDFTFAFYIEVLWMAKKYGEEGGRSESKRSGHRTAQKPVSTNLYFIFSTQFISIFKTHFFFKDGKKKSKEKKKEWSSFKPSEYKYIDRFLTLKPNSKVCTDFVSKLYIFTLLFRYDEWFNSLESRQKELKGKEERIEQLNAKWVSMELLRLC